MADEDFWGGENPDDLFQSIVYFTFLLLVILYVCFGKKERQSESHLLPGRRRLAINREQQRHAINDDGMDAIRIITAASRKEFILNNVVVKTIQVTSKESPTEGLKGSMDEENNEGVELVEVIKATCEDKLAASSPTPLVQNDLKKPTDTAEDLEAQNDSRSASLENEKEIVLMDALASDSINREGMEDSLPSRTDNPPQKEDDESIVVTFIEDGETEENELFNNTNENDLEHSSDSIHTSQELVSEKNNSSSSSASHDSGDEEEQRPDEESTKTSPLNLSIKFTPTSMTCSICLLNYEEGDEICYSQNPSCVHAFHKDCIVEWLMNHDDCPCCRSDYFDGPSTITISTTMPPIYHDPNQGDVPTDSSLTSERRVARARNVTR